MKFPRKSAQFKKGGNLSNLTRKEKLLRQYGFKCQKFRVYTSTCILIYIIFINKKEPRQPWCSLYRVTMCKTVSDPHHDKVRIYCKL